MHSAPALLACAALAIAAHSQAACLDDAAVAELARNYSALTPAATPEGLDEADGACTRAKLHPLLQAQLGPVIGYKAGLTNPAVQKRFNTDKPVWGRLYQRMLLANGATLDAAFGARPLFEADMLVRVKSAAINQARTPIEVLEAIDQIIPFIELPDLVVQAPQKLSGGALSGINVGARLGVAGTPIAVPVLRAERYALLDNLRDMVVKVTDNSNTTLAQGRGSDILGHPLQAVVWLAGALAAEHIALQPGDLVSLGSFSPLMPPKPATTITVSYEGLLGAAPVKVLFK